MRSTVRERWRPPSADNRRSSLDLALSALRSWWSTGRHYRPERRYMRGGQEHGPARVQHR